MSELTDTEGRPRAAVAFCCDAAFLPYALFAARQIRAADPDGRYDVAICSATPLEIPEGFHDLRFVTLDHLGRFATLATDARISAATYLRLALPEALGDDYDRILYLDADIFVQAGGFADLLALDLGGLPAAAVRDRRQWRFSGRASKDIAALGLPQDAYLNAGVLLIDVPAWRAGAITEAALAVAARHGEALIHKDQTMLNIALAGRWAELSPVWNWQYGVKNCLFEALQSARILHFVGKRKPWSDPHAELPPRFAASLRAFLSLHCPDAPLPAVHPAPARSARTMRRMLWRHLVRVGTTAGFLARFPDDLTVHPPRH